MTKVVSAVRVPSKLFFAHCLPTSVIFLYQGETVLFIDCQLIALVALVACHLLAQNKKIIKLKKR